MRLFTRSLALAAAVLSLAPAVAVAQDATKPVKYIIADNRAVCSGRVGENKARQNVRWAREQANVINFAGGNALAVELKPGMTIASYTGPRALDFSGAAVQKLTC